MAAKNFAGFAADLKKFAKMMDTDVAKVRRKVAFDLSKKIIERTPVDTGRAAVSWNLSEGAPNTTVAPAGQHGGAKAAAIAKAAKVRIDNPFGKAYVVNALPYIQKLEFGHSKQAPMGMVRVTLAEIEAGIQKALGE